jgi:hypothetical protein
LSDLTARPLTAALELGAPSTFSSAGKTSPECGTPLTYRILHRDRISVTIACDRRAVSRRPRDAVRVESQVPWLESIVALPRRDVTGLFGPDATVGSRQHPDYDT